jgi:hypothetical protein
MTTNPIGPAFDERGIGRYHDSNLIAQVAIEAHRRGDDDVVLAAIVLPGVLDRIVAIEEKDHGDARG